MTGKQHFTLLYDRAQRKAMTPRTIISGWSKTGLRPFNPERVLRAIQKPATIENCSPSSAESNEDPLYPAVCELETQKTSDCLATLRRDLEIDIAQQEALDAHTKLRLQKVVNAAENAFAYRAILVDENLLLFEQITKRPLVYRSKRQL
jgi:hypothetical protein